MQEQTLRETNERHCRGRGWPGGQCPHGAIEQVWGKSKKKKEREGNERREIKITCMIMNSRPVLDAYWHSVSR